MSTWNLAGHEFNIRISQHIGSELVVSKEAVWPVRLQQRTSTRHVPNPKSIWKIEVEGVVAFHGPLPAGRSGIF